MRGKSDISDGGVPKPRDLSRLAASLLSWFRANQRDLPWRQTQDPYAIWVSEIMLQQTQVKTVIPYWTRWMTALPDLEALAQVDAATLHKLWEGLGYYTRARNLQKAARAILTNHNSRFPRRFEDLLRLPGIGRYTAGAIASIAFHQPQPILDGNVIRVLTRFFAIGGNPRDKPVNEQLWGLARRLVERAARDDSRPETCSHLNQSLMELGALICTPKQPRCADCPVGKHCAALAAGSTLAYPNLPPRPATTRRRFVALVLEHRGLFLVSQRPPNGVNANLWEFPNTEVPTDTRDLTAAARALTKTGLASLEPLAVINHSITRYRIALHPYRGRLRSGAKRSSANGRWLDRMELEQLAFTSAHRKILKTLPLQVGARQP